MTDTLQGNASARSDPSISAADQAHAMHLGIAFNGVQFVYHDFKYDRLPDAVAYAELEAARGDGQAAVTNPAAWLDRPLPSAADREVMKQHGVSFDSWRYRFQDYRYDRLADAVSYASGQ